MGRGVKRFLGLSGVLGVERVWGLGLRALGFAHTGFITSSGWSSWV